MTDYECIDWFGSGLIRKAAMVESQENVEWILLWTTLFSSELICAEFVGCDNRRSFPAAVIEPVFATVEKYKRW